MRALVLLALLASCTQKTSAGRAARFQLACDSADTSQASTLFCVRMDTRTGDALVIDLDKLPVTSGPSRATEEPDGTYVMACDSTVTPQHSDFRCLRMHAQTGEIVMLRLSELPHWPSSAPAH